MADSATAAVAELMAAAGLPADRPPDPAPRSDADVERRLAELDELLARVEAIPGPAGELALEAVAALAEIYGAALARVMACASGATASGAAGPSGAPLVDSLTGDALVGHLLVLHGIHPASADERVGRALEEVRAGLGTHGGEITLLGLDGGVAEVRVAAGGGCGCGSSAGALEEAVRDAVLAAAPELTDVRVATPEAAKPATFIPLESLLHAPAGRVAHP